MAKPQLTITLDRSGQRVVKESHYVKGPVPSRKKRSKADRSIKHDSKRVKSYVSTSGRGHNRIDDSVIGPNDLRLKLTQKRISRRKQLEIAERKKMELYEKVSRAIRSAESHEEGQLRNTSSSRRADAPPPPRMDTTYAPQSTMNRVRMRSPDRAMGYVGGVSDHRGAVEERPRVPTMSAADAQRTSRPYMIDPINSTRPSVPSSTLRAVQTSGQLVTELPPATGAMSISPYPVNPPQPLSVPGLLLSLGLGKYVINFQAEEIDMLALRQMGERDMKDLGIPMGPRKKIVLAVEQHTRRLVNQVRSSNYYTQ